MPEAAAGLEQIRRLARGYSVITSAQAIVDLLGDMASALRKALEQPGPNDAIIWFLLQRLLDDRVNEFVHAYRNDLGLGTPAGAPRRWPIVKRTRPVSLEDAERIVRAHIRMREVDRPDEEPI